MTFIAERIVVTAKEFLNGTDINRCSEFTDPMYQVKLKQFGWGLNFAAASVLCEIVWKIGIGQGRLQWIQEIDRLFCPSPVATYAVFRGNKAYMTGNNPEPGALVFWKRGNSWQGHMAIVTDVHDSGNKFDVIDCRVLEGSNGCQIVPQFSPGKQMGLPFREDKLNFLGFVYPPKREIE